ncbi:MAG: leucine-rich repeat domain-containing protein [Bacteroidales bacterium]|nr:leucine-rich repeat domain-containing protein [Bacteroidales bacterium]
MKQILILLLAIIPLSSWAYDTVVNGISYNLNEKTKEAEVTYGWDNYVGDVVIPSSMTFEGVTYSVTSIGNYAFAYCDSLSSVAIPKSVTHIGEYAFRSCFMLTSLTIPDGVTTIGQGSFCNCCNLISISIPNSVTLISSYLFCDCTSLSSITIPDSVTSIGYGAFYGCKSLTSIFIPKNVASIENSIFYGCSNLSSIIVDPRNPIYDSGEGCNAIVETSTGKLIAGCKSTKLPNSVTSIGDGAFATSAPLINPKVLE